LAIIFAYVNVLLIEAGLFTPLLTPARFFRSNNGAKFHEVIAPQARMQFAADVCPLYPRKRTCAVQPAMSALGQ